MGRLTEAQWSCAIERFLVDERPVKTVAREFGVSKDSLYNRLRMRGIQLRGPKPRHSAEIRNDACERYIAGDPVREIVKATGISASVLGRELLKRGIKRQRLTPPSKLSESEWESALARYMAGEPARAIATELNISTATLYSRLVRGGIRREHIARWHVTEDEYRAILAAECARLHLSASMALGPSQSRIVVLARCRTWKRLKDDKRSYSAIARAAGFDHSTVMFGIGRLPALELTFAKAKAKQQRKPASKRVRIAPPPKIPVKPAIPAQFLARMMAGRA